jgi:hypothetical protein
MDTQDWGVPLKLSAAPFEDCKPYLFRAAGEGPFDDAVLYCFEIVIDGERHYFPAFRNMDGEDLMNREFPGQGYDRRKQYMAIAALTDGQIKRAEHCFGRFIDGKFSRLSTPLG